MQTLEFIGKLLDRSGADYEVLSHPNPIRSTADAAQYFDVAKAAPVLVLQTESGLVAFIKSAARKKVPFGDIAGLPGCGGAAWADPGAILRETGYAVGSIPLVGLDLPTVFDRALLQHDYIYGGTGHLHHTLKIAPQDVRKLNTLLAELSE